MTCDDILDALQLYVMGKDTIGLDYYVFFNPDNGKFFQRFVANGEPVDSVGKDCIEIYNNKEFHGRFTRNGFIHKELQQKAFVVLEALWEDGKIAETTYHRLQKLKNEDLVTWFTLHLINECVAYIQPHEQMEDSLHDIAQQICWKLDERGLIK